MPNKKIQIDISKAMSICLRHGVKVLPVVSGRKFKVQVDNNGEKTIYNKELTSKELNVALSKTYKHFAVLILKEDKYAKQTK